MNYPSVNIDSAASELNLLHGEIERKLRTTVQDAIRAGEILTQVKDRLDHGEFLPWIERNCEFTNKTAESYMKLHRHASKIESVSNLQDAYREVAQIESSEKQSEEKKSRLRVLHFLRTGERLEGWRRGTDDKLVEEERARDERIEKAKADMEAARVRKEQERQQRDDAHDSWQKTNDLLLEAADLMVEQSKKRKAFKERIRLSQAGESDQFIEALMDYLDELADDNRRIEACQNIIKVCRNIAAELQRGNQ